MSFQHYHYVYLCSQIRKIRKIFILDHIWLETLLKYYSNNQLFSCFVKQSSNFSERDVHFIPVVGTDAVWKIAWFNFISFSAEASWLFIQNYSHSKFFLRFLCVVFKVRLSSWPKEVPGSWFSEFKRGKIVSALSHPSFIYSFMKNILSFETKRTWVFCLIFFLYSTIGHQ